MHTAPFDYHRPGSVAEALDLLQSIDGARALAGGHSLLPVMKRRLANPAALVDLGRIPGLGGISAEAAGVTIGALVTHAAVAASEDVPRVLAETAAMIGDAQVRNRGTMGGSVAHADPAADYPTVLTALGATIVTTGGEIAAADFFVDVFTTALGEGQLVTAVHVPTVGGGAAYAKHRHPASSYAVVGVAAVVNGTGGHMVVGGATGTPVMVAGTDPAAIPGAISHPIGDLYASGEFRVHLATVLAREAVAKAQERAG